MVYIGIDPGSSGGLVCLDGHGAVILHAPTPDSESDRYDLLSQLPWNRGRIDITGRTAIIERVWSSPGWGHAGAFKFGMNYGAWLMALTAARIPFAEVLPKTWQKELGVTYQKDMTSVEKKNITKRRAQALFPGLTITHATADALLIAEYCRRVQRAHGSQEESTEEEVGVVPASRAQGRTVKEEHRRLTSRSKARTALTGAPRYGAGAKHPPR